MEKLSHLSSTAARTECAGDKKSRKYSRRIQVSQGSLRRFVPAAGVSDHSLLPPAAFDKRGRPFLNHSKRYEAAIAKCAAFHLKCEELGLTDAVSLQNASPFLGWRRGLGNRVQYHTDCIPGSLQGARNSLIDCPCYRWTCGGPMKLLTKFSPRMCTCERGA